MGVDALIFHGMTQDLVANGYARWVIHPLSYLGLYPLSHPSGSIFVLAALTESSGLVIEGAIIPYGMILVAVSLFTGFFLGMEIRRDEMFALLVAAMFSLSPRLVTDTIWEIPTRTLFTTLVPVFLFTILRWHKTHDVRWLLVLVLVAPLMMSAHRLTVLMIAVLLAFVLAVIIGVIARTLRIRFGYQILSQRFRRLTNFAVITVFFAASGALILLGGVLGSYEQGQAAIGFGIVAELSNLSVSLARSAGLLVVLVPVGVVAAYRQRDRGIPENFLLLTLFVLLPTLSLRQYTGYYIIPFTAVFLAMALRAILRRIPGSAGRVAVAALALMVTVGTAQYVVAYDLQFSEYLDNRAYSEGLYVKYAIEGTVISNDGFVASELFSVSGKPYLPVGGASIGFQSPELLIFDFLNRGRLNIYQIPFDQLTVESDSIFYLDGVNAEADWANILNNPFDAMGGRLYDTYNLTYAIEERSLLGSYTAYGNLYYSAFFESLHDNTYCVYADQGQFMWYVGTP